jgi:hypothetical protein
LADVNRDYFQRIQGFLTSASACIDFDSGTGASGFVLERLEGSAPSEYAATYSTPVIALADTVLVSRGVSVKPGSAHQPDVLIFVTAASRIIHCVIESHGQYTTIIPARTVHAMLEFSANEAYEAARKGCISIAKIAQRDIDIKADDAAVSAASAAWQPMSESCGISTIAYTP